MMTAPSVTPLPKPKRPPRFETEVTVSEWVDIDPEELEEAGWRYVGDSGEPFPTEPSEVLLIVRRWHDDYHKDAWRFCSEEPCKDLPEF